MKPESSKIRESDSQYPNLYIMITHYQNGNKELAKDIMNQINLLLEKKEITKADHIKLCKNVLSV